MDGWTHVQSSLTNWWVFDLLAVQLVGKIVDFFFTAELDKGTHMWIKKADNNDYSLYKIFFYAFGDSLASLDNTMLH